MTEWDVLMQIAKGEIFTIAKPIINRNEKKNEQYQNTYQDIYIAGLGKNGKAFCKHLKNVATEKGRVVCN